MDYINIKNNKTYKVITLDGIDCTNERDGQRVVIYTDGILFFSREYNEFMTKFRPAEMTGKSYG